jgi:hypothetical protein
MASDRRTSYRPPEGQGATDTGFNVQFGRSSTNRNSSNCGLPMFYLRVCYTDVESNGRDASYHPNRLPNVRPTGSTRADDGLSKPPCSQSVAGLTYIHSLDNGIKDHRTSCRPRTVHNRFSTCVQDSAFNKPKTPPNLHSPPRCSYLKCLICYDVENKFEASYQKPNRLPNVRPTSKRHACTRR